MRFSIIVVCLNAGEKLLQTVDSILKQSYTDYEIVVKDGGSTDGSLEKLPVDSRIRLVTRPDQGIYDAMNQAIEAATGEYVYFLNCGDYYYDDVVLQKIAGEEADIIYGNIYDRITSSTVYSNPAMDAFGCYRNVPCHQACFYRKKLVEEHPFSLEYKVRADYEQFLWCFFIAKARLEYIPELIASYEGGGFSENVANQKRSAKEHKEITEKYMTRKQLLQYKIILFLTLSKVRTYLSHDPFWGKLYNGFKRLVYRK